MLDWSLLNKTYFFHSKVGHSGRILGIVGADPDGRSYVLVEVLEILHSKVPVFYRIFLEASVREWRLYAAEAQWETDKASVRKWREEK